MGSPEFAIPTLKTLISHTNLVGVVSQPDRPAGRGRKIVAPPVKLVAEEFGIPVIQPRRLSEESAMQRLSEWNPDLIVVAAFGQILRKNVLELPRYGCINVHASLLPRWRGAAPIHAAILHGDAESGVTIMQMDAGLDTGPILTQRSVSIDTQETAQSLSDKLADLGADLLMKTLPGYISGEIHPIPQPVDHVTQFGSIKKAQGKLDFNHTAVELERRVRAFTPWPGTFFFYNDQRLIVHRARVVNLQSPGIGERFIHEELPAIGTTEGVLLLETVQPSGKKAMSGTIYLRGAKDWINDEH